MYNSDRVTHTRYFARNWINTPIIFLLLGCVLFCFNFIFSHFNICVCMSRLYIFELSGKVFVVSQVLTLSIIFFSFSSRVKERILWILCFFFTMTKFHLLLWIEWCLLISKFQRFLLFPFFRIFFIMYFYYLSD